LFNAANSSATFNFAEIAKAKKPAILIGETTGGNQQGLNTGTMFFLRLLHSQIEVDIPIIGSFSPDKSVGVIGPHIEVKETPEDVYSNRDPAIEFTKKTIAKKLNRRRPIQQARISRPERNHNNAPPSSIPPRNILLVEGMH
jgi:hypothetical protein